MQVSEYSLWELDILPKPMEVKVNLLQLFSKNCVTPRGSQILKIWLKSPLSCSKLISQKQDAIAFFIEHKTQAREIRRLIYLCYQGFEVLRDFFDRDQPIFGNSNYQSTSNNSEMLDLAENESNLQRKDILQRLGKTLSDLNEILKDTDCSYLNLSKGVLETIFGTQLQSFQPFHGIQDFLNCLKKEGDPLDNLIRWRDKKILDTVTNSMLLFDLAFLGNFLWEIDSILALTAVAITHDLSRPEFLKNTDNPIMQIQDGWHPLINVEFPSYIKKEIATANDLSFDHQNLAYLITGPNAGGKTSYLKMVGINVVLAHLGSFVAAKSLRLSPISNLLTCLRTQDSLTTGESAFIWQQRYLNEKVIAQADKQSLVLLDEISSGTSGYRDGGESLAAGVLLYTVENCGCFCLFASHFEYLPSIPSHNKVSGIKNIHPKKDSKGWSTFKMVPGKGRSDGLEAVKKHIPDFNPEVIKKAEEARLTIEALRKQKS